MFLVNYTQRWEKVGIYFGTYSRSLDVKHRLQVPTKLVKELPARFYAVKGHEGCLAIFEEEAYKKFLETLESRSFLDRAVRAYVRQVAGSTIVLDVDSHGRIAFPTAITEAYGFGMEVNLVGVIDHFEVWGKENYAKAISSHDDEYDDLAQTIAESQVK